MTLNGCGKNNGSYYGAAPQYKNVAGGKYSPNCYAYAIGLDQALDPGMKSQLKPRFNKVKKVADAVIKDLKALGRSGRIISGPNAKINSNEYRIAVRCGTKKYVYNIFTGEYLISEYYGDYDYHFMMQTSDGRWAEKHGMGGNSILHDVGETPNTLSWDLGNLRGYYDSEIIYLAITR